MVKSSAAANVIDLEAFRRRRMREVRPAEDAPALEVRPIMVPVWFCWIPVYTPVFG